MVTPNDITIGDQIVAACEYAKSQGFEIVTKTFGVGAETCCPISAVAIQDGYITKVDQDAIYIATNHFADKFDLEYFTFYRGFDAVEVTEACKQSPAYKIGVYVRNRLGI